VHDWLEYIRKSGEAAVGKFWQRNYYERIIRDEKMLKKVRE
jgi:hypothetical protein